MRRCLRHGADGGNRGCTDGVVALFPVADGGRVGGIEKAARLGLETAAAVAVRRRSFGRQRRAVSRLEAAPAVAAGGCNDEGGTAAEYLYAVAVPADDAEAAAIEAAGGQALACGDAGFGGVDCRTDLQTVGGGIGRNAVCAVVAAEQHDITQFFQAADNGHADTFPRPAQYGSDVVEGDAADGKVGRGVKKRDSTVIFSAEAVCTL